MRKKEIVTLALTAVILMTTPVMPVSATEIVTDEVPSKSLHIITPQWTSTNTVVPLISISGKKISVSVAIDPKKSTTTSVGTLYLEKKVGKGWTPAASWPIDAVGQVGITKTYNGTTGTTYRTRVVITTGVDEIDVASNERTV